MINKIIEMKTDKITPVVIRKIIIAQPCSPNDTLVLMVIKRSLSE